MTPISKRTKLWRELRGEEICIWRQKVKFLRKIAQIEHWHYERFEMEVVQLIKQKDLVDTFIFAKNYVARHKKGKYRRFMFETVQEVLDYGTIEPSKLRKIKKSIQTARRKMK